MKTYLVPFDFSNNAGTALTYAIQLSSYTGAGLIVFHCYTPAFTNIAESKTEADREILMKKDMDLLTLELQKQVDIIRKGLGMEKMPGSIEIGVEMSPVVVEKIIEVAQTTKADLIIMGTHGASGLTRRLFGSNTSTLIEKSDIPVLAIPVNWPFEKIQTIAMATDLADFNHELEKVVPFASLLNAEIDVVYLDYGIDAYRIKESQATRFLEKEAYKKIRFTKQNATIEKPLLVQLKSYLNEVKPQWLVMFTREHKFWTKLLLMSKTEDLVNSRQLPILSLKKNMLKVV